MTRPKNIFILLSFFFTGLLGFAQKFTVQVSSSTVQYGQMFELVYTINTNASNFTPPSFKDFDVAGGPNQSSSIQVINGQMTQNISISYVLVPKKTGKITIPTAIIVAGGKKLQSGPVTIEVVGSGGNSGQASGNQNTNIKPEAADIFIKTIFSKQKCMMGEQLIVSQKVFSRHQIVGFQKFNPPAYENFWSKTLESTSGNQVAQENIGGVVYFTYELFRNQVTPNISGQIEIKPIEGEVIIRRASKNKPRNIFEQFFGGGGYEDVAVKVKSKPSYLNVLPLPNDNKPASFRGAVGEFNYKIETSKNEVKANDAFNLKMTISGKGNIKLIDAPELELPPSFESYEPKISESNGTKTFDYLIIPREEGEFKLENLDFSYYNLNSKKYVTIPSPEISIKVLPPDPNSKGAEVYVSQKKVKETENDIRYIKRGHIFLNQDKTEFFNSLLHWILMLLPIVLLIIALLLTKRHRLLESDVVGSKSRKAMKLAKKHLSKAQQSVQQNNKEEFYSEVFVALTNYLSDKFSIPKSDSSKEIIVKKLNENEISQELITETVGFIESAEYARYAPSSLNPDLKGEYDKVVKLIVNIDNNYKSRKT